MTSWLARLTLEVGPPARLQPQWSVGLPGEEGAVWSVTKQWEGGIRKETGRTSAGCRGRRSTPTWLGPSALRTWSWLLGAAAGEGGMEVAVGAAVALQAGAWQLGQVWANRRPPQTLTDP